MSSTLTATRNMLRQALAVIGLAAVLLLAPSLAWAIDVSHAVLEPVDEGYAVNADFQVELTPRIEEALQNGVAL